MPDATRGAQPDATSSGTDAWAAGISQQADAWAEGIEWEEAQNAWAGGIEWEAS